MIFRHLTGFLRKHGRISKGALERSSSTNSRDVSTEYFYAMFANEFSCLVPGHPSRRHLDPNKFAEKKQQRFQIGDISRLKLISRYTINRVLSKLRCSIMILGSQANRDTRPTHQTPKPFYITLRRQINPPLGENFACELHQVMILHLSRAGLTS
jgi:hypothetical protein